MPRNKSKKAVGYAVRAKGSGHPYRKRATRQTAQALRQKAHEEMVGHLAGVADRITALRRAIRRNGADNMAAIELACMEIRRAFAAIQASAHNNIMEQAYRDGRYGPHPLEEES